MLSAVLHPMKITFMNLLTCSARTHVIETSGRHQDYCFQSATDKIMCDYPVDYHTYNSLKLRCTNQFVFSKHWKTEPLLAIDSSCLKCTGSDGHSLGSPVELIGLQKFWSLKDKDIELSLKNIRHFLQSRWEKHTLNLSNNY